MKTTPARPPVRRRKVKEPEPSTELERLLAAIGIPLTHSAILDQALTHRSCTRERGEDELQSNERLEFLGDAVVQFIISALLYEQYPHWSEGDLTRARSAIVSRDPMTKAAERLNLGRHLKLGKPEDEAGGRDRPSILSSAYEAVAAAVFLAAGTEAAGEFVRRTLGPEIDSIESIDLLGDCKTQLQEKCQAVFHLTPTYAITGSEGPAHHLLFTADALLDGKVLASGVGRSKKDAEQDAARNALASAFHG